ncbi:MAG: hypothetical protein ACR2NW_01575 [Thermodesulfobacteriota bacterium]
MAEGKSLKEKKELLLKNTQNKIDRVYCKGLYNFIEKKPAYYDELEKIEDRIHHIFISDYKSTDELRKELSKYFGVHQRASKAFGILK